MKIGRSSDGFTIIETLVVLAITGVLFVIAFSNLDQTQKKITFKTAVFDLQTQLESIINKAANGTYNGGGITCASGSATVTNGIPGNLPYITAGGTNQGSSSSCYFIGLALNFRRTKITTAPLVALAPTSGSGQIPGTLTYSPYTPIVAPEAPTDLSFTNQASLLNSATPYGQSYYDPTYNFEGGLSLATNHGNYTCPGTTCDTSQAYYNDPYGYLIAAVITNNNGENVTDLAPYVVYNPGAVNLGNSFFNTDSSKGTTYPNYGNDFYYDAWLVPATTAELCFDSGTTNQSVIFSFNNGGVGGGISITTKLFQVTDCNDTL